MARTRPLASRAPNDSIERRSVQTTLIASHARMNTRRLRWRRVVFWTTFLILCGACALSAHAALDRDEGAFLAMAQQILHGRLPYRDLFDQKSPAIYYLLAGLLALTRSLNIATQIVTLRLCATLVNALSAVGLLRIGAQWRRPEAGRLAALLWLAACAVPFFGANLLFTEPFAACATIWAVERLTARIGVRSAFVAGLLLAASSLFKQTAILALPSICLLLINPYAPSGAARDWRPSRALAALGAGVALPWLAVGGAFAAAGAWQPFTYQVIIVNLFGYPAHQDIVGGMLTLLQAVVIVYAGPLALVLWRVLQQRRLPRREKAARDLTLPALLLLIALEAAPSVAHPYPHYLIVALPWLALLLACGLTPGAATSAAHRDEEPQASSSFFTRLGLAARPMFIALSLIFNVAVAIQSSIMYAYALPMQIAIGEQIARETPPSARLLIGPAEPEYYYLSGHAPSAPYLYLLPVDQRMFPPSEVARDIHTGGFDEVVWWTAPVTDVASHTYDPILAALQHGYHVAPSNVPDLIVFVRN